MSFPGSLDSLKAAHASRRSSRGKKSTGHPAPARARRLHAIADAYRKPFAASSLIGLFVLCALIAFATHDGDPGMYFISRHLFIFPVMLAGYLYGRDIAILTAVGAGGLFFPVLVHLIYEHGPTPVGVELAGLIAAFHIIALFISSQVENDRARNKLVDAMDQLGKLIEKSLDLNNLLPTVLQQSVRLGDADDGEIFFLRGEPEQVPRTSQVPPGRPDVDAKVIPSRQNLLDWQLRRDEPVQIIDLEDDPRFDVPAELAARHPSLLSMTLRKGHDVIGVVALWRYGGTPFRQVDADLLRILADKSELAIDNAWLYSQTDQALSKQTEELALLLGASTAFSSTLDLDRLLETICRKIIESVGGTYCRIKLLEDNGRTLLRRGLYAVRDQSLLGVDGQAIPIDSLEWHQRALAEGEPVVLQRDDLQMSITDAERSILFSSGAQSVLLMPIGTKGRQWGVAVLGEMRSWQRSPLTPEKIELCRGIARLGSLALENILTFEKLAYQSQRVQLIIDNVADGVFSTDLEGRILAFNPAAERITGLSAAEVIGRRCAEVLHGVSENSGPLCTNGCPLAQPIDLWEDPRPILLKEHIKGRNTSVLVAHSLAPLIDQNGRVTGTVSVLRDIAREEELARLKTDFISLVSHQLRTPLAYISASAELLANKELAEATRDDMLLTLQGQCSRLNRLVNQVLSAARLEQGQIDITPEPLALIPLIEQTTKLYRSLFTGHHFRVECPSRNIYAIGDRTSVEVVLDNLLQNAVKYSPEKTTITISVIKQEGVVRVSVADQGVGIRRDQLDDLFKRFRRLNEEGEKTSGFGLGLYISKLLIEAQGGQIWAESTLGEGACFYFTLNLVEAEDEEGPDY